MTALTPEQQARADRIEGAPDAPESLRERMAVTLWRSDTEDEFPDADLERLWPKVVSHFPTDAAAYRRLADAAIAVMRGEQHTTDEETDRG
jgi:hypothetical protein